MTNLSQFLRVVLLASCLALVYGCAATVSMAPEAEDAAAKEFVPRADEANIYVVRKDEFVGSAVAFEVKLDGVSVGSLAPGTFLLIEVAPGEHVVSSHTSENQSVCPLTTVAGQNYYIELSPQMGWVAARCSLEQLDEETGRELVMKASLAEDLQIGD